MFTDDLHFLYHCQCTDVSRQHFNRSKLSATFSRAVTQSVVRELVTVRVTCLPVRGYFPEKRETTVKLSFYRQKTKLLVPGTLKKKCRSSTSDSLRSTALEAHRLTLIDEFRGFTNDISPAYLKRILSCYVLRFLATIFKLYINVQ